MLAIDLPSFMARLFGQVLATIDVCPPSCCYSPAHTIPPQRRVGTVQAISLSPCFRLRKIFTLRTCPPDTSSPDTRPHLISRCAVEFISSPLAGFSHTAFTAPGLIYTEPIPAAVTFPPTVRAVVFVLPFERVAATTSGLSIGVVCLANTTGLGSLHADSASSASGTGGGALAVVGFAGTPHGPTQAQLGTSASAGSLGQQGKHAHPALTSTRPGYQGPMHLAFGHRTQGPTRLSVACPHHTAVHSSRHPTLTSPSCSCLPVTLYPRTAGPPAYAPSSRASRPQSRPPSSSTSTSSLPLRAPSQRTTVSDPRDEGTDPRAATASPPLGQPSAASDEQRSAGGEGGTDEGSRAGGDDGGVGGVGSDGSSRGSSAEGTTRRVAAGAAVQQPVSKMGRMLSRLAKVRPMGRWEGGDRPGGRSLWGTSMCGESEGGESGTHTVGIDALCCSLLASPSTRPA